MKLILAKEYVTTKVWKLFDKKCFIDNKVQGKIFHGYMTYSNNFTLNIILQAIIHTTTDLEHTVSQAIIYSTTVKFLTAIKIINTCM